MLNRRIVVVLPITLDIHTFRKMWKALLILVFTTFSVHPLVSTVLQISRYLNVSTCSSFSSAGMIGISRVVLRLRIFVFFLLIFNSTYADIRSSPVVLSCIWCWLRDCSARSSAKSRSLSWVKIVHWITILFRLVSVFMTQVTASVPVSSVHNVLT